MTRNGDELPFYVIQFLELPYEGIDEYVCIPHTWVIVRTAPGGKAVVAYPKDEDPSLTRDRAKRKERYSDEWTFYMAVVKHRSNSYENAKHWIASRIYHRRSIERIADNLVERETRIIPNTQPESTPNTNSRNLLILNNDPRKPIMKILIKRPAALSEPERDKQLDGKRMKLNETTLSFLSSTSVTDANTESKRQDNQSTKVAQAQETAAISNINSRTEQKTQTQRTEQNKEDISLPVIDVDGPPEVIEIDDRHHSQGIKTSNQNNSTSHSHLSNNTAAVSMSAAKPSTSTARSTQENQYINQEYILDSRSSLLNFKPQLENVRSAANSHNDHGLCGHDVSNNPQTTSHKVINSLKMSAQLCDNVYRIEDLKQTRNAIKEKILLRNMKRNLKKSAQNSSNLMDQPGSSSAHAVEEQSAIVQTRSQDGTDQTASLWEMTIDSPEIQHASKRISEKAGNAPLVCSANRPTAAQNSTSMNPTTRVRYNLEQQMLDNFAILFTQMCSTLRDITDMYNTLRTSILDIAKIYKELLCSVEQFNSMPKSAGNESFSINLNPQVHQSPEERPSEVTAGTSSSPQSQHSNDDVNKPLKKKHNSLRIVLPPEYDPHDTKWTLKYQTNLPGLVELMPESGVYVSVGDLNYCQHVSKDCKSLARRLLSEVFSRNALSVCLSISERAQAPDNIVGSDTRPELDDHACTVLLNYTDSDVVGILTSTLSSALSTVRCKRFGSNTVYWLNANYYVYDVLVICRAV